MSDLRTELEYAINRCSAENGCNTPDFILASYLVGCLVSFDDAVNRREKWFGREPDLIAHTGAMVSPVGETKP
jgi:hypothetical protein